MIYLVRHGLDDERYMGGYSMVGLVLEGEKQMERVSSWFVKEKMKFDRIYTSDVRRAMQSAMIIVRKIGGTVILDSSFRELDKGKLNGMLLTDARRMYPDFVGNDDVSLVYPDGESMGQLYDRIKSLYDRMDEYDNSLVVTHRGVINMLYFMLNDKKIDMDKEQFGVTHGSVHELDIVKKKIRRVR